MSVYSCLRTSVSVCRERASEDRAPDIYTQFQAGVTLKTTACWHEIPIFVHLQYMYLILGRCYLENHSVLA